jgi:hypothetical protein
MAHPDADIRIMAMQAESCLLGWVVSAATVGAARRKGCGDQPSFGTVADLQRQVLDICLSMLHFAAVRFGDGTRPTLPKDAAPFIEALERSQALPRPSLDDRSNEHE